MRKNQDGLTFVPLLLIALALIVLGGLATYQYKSSNSQKSSCEVTAEMKASNRYFVPCEVVVSMREGHFRDIERLEQLVRPINGTITGPIPELGVYSVIVKPGTEEEAIKYLEAQSEIKEAKRNTCCATTTNQF